jgi:hypothetical protein
MLPDLERAEKIGEFWSYPNAADSSDDGVPGSGSLATAVIVHLRGQWVDPPRVPWSG